MFIIKNDKGFSLIEVLVAMTLLSIVLLVAYNLLFSGMKSWIYGEDQIDVVQNMRVGMDSMTREIRSANEINENKSNEKEIVFTAPDTTFSAVKEVRYRYDSKDKELERKDINNFQPISSRISNIEFSYIPVDSDRPISSDNPIKIVVITMEGAKKDGHKIEIKSKVTLRSVR